MAKSSPPMGERYRLAERFLPWNRERYIVNGEIQHRWLGNEDRLSYRRKTLDGSEFVLLTATTATILPAFDHIKVAAGLTSALNRKVEPHRLPFEEFDYVEGGRAIRVVVSGKSWTCELATGACVPCMEEPRPDDEIIAPNRRWAVGRLDYNLTLRLFPSGERLQLTTDGTKHYAYGATTGDDRKSVTLNRRGQRFPPHVLWSPDSRHILTHRLDERHLGSMHLIESVPTDGSVRPKLHSYKYALPGDRHVPIANLCIVNIESRQCTFVDDDPLNTFLMTPIEARNVWWSKDGTKVYYIRQDRFSKSLTLSSADPATGHCTRLVSETAETFLLARDGGLHEFPCVRTLSNGDILWYSERTGWGHLYYYTASGVMRNVITQGSWVVREILYIDETRERLFIACSSVDSDSDPYLCQICVVNFDGSGFRPLTNPGAEASIWRSTRTDDERAELERSSFSPSARYFVMRHSLPDQPPVFQVRKSSGDLIGTFEKADTGAILADGYLPPERFCVVAADGETLLYGNLFRPSWFESSQTYPIIDTIYPGPHITVSANNYVDAVFGPMCAQALAELGAIVVTIDGRGTPHRSKAFLDDVYGDMGKAGNLEDHVSAVCQLADRFPFIDLARVGIWGHSGGGFASLHAILKYPDFYKVAVSSSGNHDQRLNYASWGETYNGDVRNGAYEGACNHVLAQNLRGKLLLVHGELDENVPLAQSLKVVDALVKANKDFDFFIMPGENHGSWHTPYFVRRKWDFFVRHLLGEEPPSDYKIAK